MPEHVLDLPLAGLVAVLVVKEAFGVVRAVLAKRNGWNGLPATQLSLAEAKAEILIEVRTTSDRIHARINEVSDRVARLEG